MRNYVLSNRDVLKQKNYITKAGTGDYWFNFSFSKLQDYVLRCNGEFNVVIAGSDEIEDDFFVIPYRVVRHVFTEDYLYKDSAGGGRWVGSIRDGYLRVRNFPETVNIDEYYGQRSYLS